MPLAVRFRQGLYRLIDLDTNGIATGANGEAIDKGGGATEAVRARLVKQAQAINLSQQERKQRMVEASRILSKRLSASKHKKRKRYG